MHYLSYGVYAGDSEDGLYMIVVHNGVCNDDDIVMDTPFNDSTRVLKGAIVKISKLYPLKVPLRKKVTKPKKTGKSR